MRSASLKQQSNARHQLNIALVGAASRGGKFAAAFAAHPRTRIHAVCDVRGELLAEAQAKTGAQEAYTDYAEMLAKSAVDAVVIGTPMQFHAPQAILALERGVHVLSEVTAGVTVDECRALAVAAGRSRAVYMMAENYAYMKPNVLVKELVRRGLFGELYYAEGGIHPRTQGSQRANPVAAQVADPALTGSPTRRIASARSSNGWRATG